MASFRDNTDIPERVRRNRQNNKRENEDPAARRGPPGFVFSKPRRPRRIDDRTGSAVAHSRAPARRERLQACGGHTLARCRGMRLIPLAVFN
ncbi:hypothetical protein C7S16_2969 [Burkholderia thailandensis]|uniref:Uncharacterized protein n=1 Tax=Burkholderia thailandensis TaxID=57975 RepID=A0AAW9D2R5_BURTH|nr:hypothetical protein [Burkholderia thailandensis]MDW9256606.1 hypothetical protein [Burkholderia thailandensis]